MYHHHRHRCCERCYRKDYRLVHQPAQCTVPVVWETSRDDEVVATPPPITLVGSFCLVLISSLEVSVILSVPTVVPQAPFRLVSLSLISQVFVTDTRCSSYQYIVTGTEPRNASFVQARPRSYLSTRFARYS